MIDNSENWAADSCTLPTAEQPLRTAEFDRFFAESVREVRRVRPTRLDLLIVSDAEELGRDLAARESECCSFFDFAFTTVGDDVVMRIGVPDSQVEVLDALTERARARVHE
ncbi:hypothetical protein [Nocardia suismassiliense]|uniref:hypothetical protein n=1 Tax=Nocardia suismassiliense TaxID=2077092 RepID=UPI000D1FBCEE|nr:hypothetical protein [Nocardia suismassiliense]